MNRKHFSRRAFMTGLTLVGSAGWLGVRPEPVGADPPPETTTLKLVQFPIACFAPYYLAEELLRGEGFTDVRYAKLAPSQTNLKALSSGDVHLTVTDIHTALLHLDAEASIVLLAGVHGGCYELFGTNGVRAVRELKGRIVSVANPGRQAFVASMAAWIGLNPSKDIDFLMQPASSGMELFAQGVVDAFMGSPPDPQELRTRKIGSVVVDTKVSGERSRGGRIRVGPDPIRRTRRRGQSRRVWEASQRCPSLLMNATRRVPLRVPLNGKRISGLALTAEVIWNSPTGWSSKETSICFT